MQKNEDSQDFSDLGEPEDAIFESAYNRTSGYEGGYTEDIGGKTNYGITQTC